MKNSILVIGLLFLSSSFFAQGISINADGSSPAASAILDIKSTDKGLLLPRMSTAQRDAIAGPEHGLMIFNTSANCLQVNSGTPGAPAWNCLSVVTPPPPAPAVGELSCANATFTPAAFTGHQTYAGVLSVPYTGGNGAAYPGGVATGSTGVTGLTAVLLAGTLNNGSGTVNYLVAGTPVSGGIASFPLAFGGQACAVSFGGTHSIPGNSTCAQETISATGCGAVAGATLNDDPATPNGAEYNWTGAAGYMHSTVRALVEIGGQCWFRYNALANTANANNWPTGVNTTYGTPIEWGDNLPDDLGFHGYFNVAVLDGTDSWQAAEPAPGEGQLYQWSAAMNGSSTERAQGVCPAGWHIPSDCEWMYLESTLGMGPDQQQLIGFRTEGSPDVKLLAAGSSGFNGLLGGLRAFKFNQRGSFTQWWSSTAVAPSGAMIRSFLSGEPGSYRNSSGLAVGAAVRCLKD